METPFTDVVEPDWDTPVIDAADLEISRTAIERGQTQGELRPDVNPMLAAEVLTGIYFDTLSRWLTEGEPPFDLPGVLSEKLDLVLFGLAVPATTDARWSVSSRDWATRTRES